MADFYTVEKRNGNVGGSSHPMARSSGPQGTICRFRSVKQETPMAPMPEKIPVPDLLSIFGDRLRCTV